MCSTSWAMAQHAQLKQLRGRHRRLPGLGTRTHRARPLLHGMQQALLARKGVCPLYCVGDDLLLLHVRRQRLHERPAWQHAFFHVEWGFCIVVCSSA